MPADAPDRPEPSGRVDVGRRETGVAVPPPRPAPAVEAVPTVEPDQADLTGAVPASDAAPAPGAASAGSAERPGGLTERDQRILAFEQQWWKHAGAKEQAIRDTFGLSATRYYQLLNALLDHPAALAAEPLLIGRLRRLRGARARSRRR
ncbi:DUF3263 domain-containing protein [Micromonospora sp. SL1-18]|uniref:DUF3263 domain-containing protein n=1 Tax=Micromonospora sp. SL1-18 TaxID=3399128 RepID=UPI003A4E2B09